MKMELHKNLADVYVPGKPRALKSICISSLKIKQYPDYVMKIQYSTKKSFKKAKTVSNKGRSGTCD